MCKQEVTLAGKPNDHINHNGAVIPEFASRLTHICKVGAPYFVFFLSICNVDNFVVGLQICYDLRFPEVFQILSKKSSHLMGTCFCQRI